MYKFLRTRLENGQGNSRYFIIFFKCNDDRIWFSNDYVAAAAAKKVQRVQKKRVGQIHTNTHFFRPKTLVLARKPKYERTSIAKDNKMDAYAVIKKPVVTEAAMKKIEVGCSIL